MMRVLRLASLVFLLSGMVVLAAAPARRRPVPPNIVLITMDTTRADRMGFLGSGLGLTPNLDILAKQSVVFSRAYSQIPLTTPSHAVILTGTYPQFNHVRELDAPLNGKLPYLPDILRRNGYRTGAMLASSVLDPKSNAEGFDRGFSTYDAGFHPQAVGEDRYQSEERRAEVVVDHAVKWLSQARTRPFFLWVHFYDPHSPYDPPEPYRTRYSKSLYDGEIAYMDSAIGRLLTTLREKNLYDGALIAAMADHGEAFGEHGELYHGVFVYDATINVPLLFKLPGERLAGERRDVRVGLVDVAPTLLQLSGFVPPAGMQGQSLLPLMETKQKNEKRWGDRRIYSESEYGKVAFNWSPLYAWRTDKYLFVAAPERELYDQNTDPDAQRNIAFENKGVADTLVNQLAQFQKETSSAAGTKADIGDGGSDSLAALGYVASSGAVSRGIEDVGGVDPKGKVVIANGLHKSLLDSQDPDPQAAIAGLEKIIEQEPNTRMAYLVLGRCYRRLKQPDKAIPMLRKAAETMPRFGAAQYELGRTLVETGDWAGAIPAFEAAVADSPQQAEWHFDLAVIYERTQRLPEAMAQFRETLKRDPNHFRSNLLLGRLLGMQGNAAEGLPYLLQAVKIDPKSVEAHTFLANVYTELGQTRNAELERAKVEHLKSGPAN
jgi:arylsulfatase A-like enzyme/Tfp pilus assembly protein PilF